MLKGTLASAVVLPETHDDPPSPNSFKRRQSYIDESEPKRPRTDQNSPPRPSPDERRRSSAVSGKGSGATEERKRGQRLFGALLGTLSQSSSSPAQRRRADIEKKQRDKLKEKEQELDDERRQKSRKLLEKRRKEQIVWDKDSARVQHESMLSMAHFLKTKAEPQLYYKPWELLPDETKQIEEQMAIARTKIDSDIASNENVPCDNDVTKSDEVLLSRHQSPLPTAKTDPQQTPKQENGAENAEEVHNGGGPGQQHGATRSNGEPSPDTNQQESSGEGRIKAENKGDLDTKGTDEHGGEELLEGAEDSVIY